VNHPDKPAVAVCADCGCGLCHECSHKYGIYICDRCVSARNSEINERESTRKREIVAREKRCVNAFFALLLVMGFYTINYINSLHLTLLNPADGGWFGAIVYAVFFPCLPWGWRTISDLTSKIHIKHTWFIGGPLLLFYWLYKAIFSIMIGPFVTPSKMKRALKIIRESKETNNF